MNARPPCVPLRRLALAAALACGALLTACGGGGGDTSSSSTATPLSQSDATADAANAAATGSDAASAIDDVVDATATLARTAAATPASGGRARALSVVTSAGSGSGAGSVTVDCAGGGTATLSVTGGTAASELNGQLDAGEHYSVTYAQCTGAAGMAQLDGDVAMDVTAADYATVPSTLAVSLTVSHLSLSLPSGSATLDGTATVSRSVAATGATTVTTSQVTVPSATLATAFNARSGSFVLTGLDATRTVTSVAGIATASQYAGHHTLSGTAHGRTFSMTVATTGALDDDATGALVSGAWSVVRPHATIAATLANGVVVLTVDEGNDGTIDHTWTFAKAMLDAAAG